MHAPSLCVGVSQDRILSNFVEANRVLEVVLKQLYQFLETKRVAFPRFYFLSNEELLEILAETMDPLLVQPHMKKCFEGIYRLEFQANLDITGVPPTPASSLWRTDVVLLPPPLFPLITLPSVQGS